MEEDDYAEAMEYAPSIDSAHYSAHSPESPLGQALLATEKKPARRASSELFNGGNSLLGGGFNLNLETLSSLATGNYYYSSASSPAPLDVTASPGTMDAAPQARVSPFKGGPRSGEDLRRPILQQQQGLMSPHTESGENGAAPSGAGVFTSSSSSGSGGVGGAGSHGREPAGAARSRTRGLTSGDRVDAPPSPSPASSSRTQPQPQRPTQTRQSLSPARPRTASLAAQQPPPDRSVSNSSASRLVPLRDAPGAFSGGHPALAPTRSSSSAAAAAAPAAPSSGSYYRPTAPAPGSSGSTPRGQPLDAFSTSSWQAEQDAAVQSSTAQRLEARILAQGAEITELTSRLAAASEYTHTVERRLLEISPDHNIPVTEAELGLPVTSLSRLAATAAAGSQQALALIGGGTISSRASHIIAAAAVHRKEQADASDAIRRLEKTLNETRSRLTDTHRRMRDIRGVLEVRDREKAALSRRVETLQQKLVSLEAESRLALGGGPLPPALITLFRSAVAASAPPPDPNGPPPSAPASASSSGANGDAITRLTAEGEAMRRALNDRDAEVARLAAALAAATAAAPSGSGASPLQRLEGEKAALLDFIADAQQRESGMQGQVQRLESTVARLRADAAASATSAETADASLRRVTSQLAEAQTRVARLEAGEAEARARVVRAEAEAGERRRQAEEALAMQSELLAAVRRSGGVLPAATQLHLSSASGSPASALFFAGPPAGAGAPSAGGPGPKGESAATTAVRFADLERRLRSAEAALEHAEAERDGAGDALRDTRAALDAATTRAAEAGIDKDAAEAARRDSAAKLAATEESLRRRSAELSQLEAQLRTSRTEAAEAGRAAVELASLRATVGEHSAARAALASMVRALGVVGDGPAADAPAASTRSGGGVDVGAAAAAVALGRAAAVVRVAEDDALISALPDAAQGLRGVAGWLRTAGTALAELSRASGADAESARAARSLLYEELRSLRAEAATAATEVQSSRVRVAAAEQAASAAETARDTETALLRDSLRVTTEERDRVTALEVRLRNDLTAATERVGTLSAALEASVEAEAQRDAARTEVTRLSASLTALASERRALGDRLLAVEAEADRAHEAARAAAAEAADARRALGNAEARLADLTSSTHRAEAEASAATQRADAASAKAARLSEDIEAAMRLSSAQNSAVEVLEARLSTAATDATLLRRANLSLTMELEGLRAAAEAAAEAAGELVRREGIDTADEAALLAAAAAASGGTGRGGVAPFPPYLLPSPSPPSHGAPGSPMGAGGTAQLALHLRAVVSLLVSSAHASALRLGGLGAECGALRQEIHSLRSRVAAVDEVAAGAADTRARLAAAESAVAEARGALSRCESDLRGARGEASALQVRCTDLQRELDRAGSVLGALVPEVEAGRRAAAAGGGDHGRAEASAAALAATREALSASRTEASEARVTAAAAVARVTHLQGELDSREAVIGDLSSQLQAMAGMQAALEDRVAAELAAATDGSGTAPPRQQQRQYVEGEAAASAAAMRGGLAELSYRLREQTSEADELRAQLAVSRAAGAATGTPSYLPAAPAPPSRYAEALEVLERLRASSSGPSSSPVNAQAFAAPFPPSFTQGVGQRQQQQQFSASLQPYHAGSSGAGGRYGTGGLGYPQPHMEPVSSSTALPSSQPGGGGSSSATYFGGRRAVEQTAAAAADPTQSGHHLHSSAPTRRSSITLPQQQHQQPLGGGGSAHAAVVDAVASAPAPDSPATQRLRERLRAVQGRFEALKAGMAAAPLADAAAAH